PRNPQKNRKLKKRNRPKRKRKRKSSFPQLFGNRKDPAQWAGFFFEDLQKTGEVPIVSLMWDFGVRI
ncbi:MAG: hypothetical protein LJE88_09450, partial [Deltaproteobacteria bacterium]|nr:hypothetical protein [Deltaproteobacteria bacterium]